MTEKKHSNRQAIRSRKMLQDALLDLLREKPYQKITISAITEQAGLTRPTFYAHFETKDDLLLSYVDDIFDEFFGELRPEVHPYQPDKLRAIEIQASFFEQWKENAEILHLIRTADIDLRILDRLKDYHLQTYQDVIAPQFPELNPTVTGFYIDFLAAATFGLLKHWMDEKMVQPPEVMAKMLHQLVGAHQLIALIEAIDDAVK